MRLIEIISLRYQPDLRFFFNLHIPVIVAYVGVLLTNDLPYLNNSAIFQFVRLTLVLYTTFGLFGLNAVSLLEMMLKKRFSRLEFAVLAIFLSLIGAPLMLSVEYTGLKVLFVTLPFINTLIVFSLVLLFRHFFRQEYVPLSQWQMSKKLAPSIFKNPLIIWSVIAYASVIIVMTNTYYALTELDPYFWYITYQAEFSSEAITPLNLFRPLFSALSYIVTQTGGLAMYPYFKYFVPSLIILCLPPQLLFATTMKKSWRQTIPFFLPAITASTLSYLFIPIPQAILTIILIASLSLILYSCTTGQQFFYYISGILLFFSYFYHEIAILIFLPWLLATLIYDRKRWIGFVRRQPIITLLLVLLILSHLKTIFLIPLDFVLGRMNLVIHLMASAKPNLLFPTYYINVDGLSVGWAGITGLMKYYLYYVGPTVFALLIAFGFLWWKSRDFRQYCLKELRTKKEVAALVYVFFFFFIIAEVLPRAVNLSYLPERAWIFASIFSLVFIYLILSFHQKNKPYIKWLAMIFMFGCIMNIGATLYINSLKRYMITPAQLRSTDWIKQELPDNRFLLSYGNEGLLKVHGESQMCDTSSPNFYFDKQETDRIFRLCGPQLLQQRLDHYQEDLSRLKKSLNELEKMESLSDILIGSEDKFQAILHETSALQADVAALKSAQQSNSFAYYIYYSEVDQQNPYLDRPYFISGPEAEGQPLLFDSDPKRFRRVYSDEENNIFIWQVL